MKVCLIQATGSHYWEPWDYSQPRTTSIFAWSIILVDGIQRPKYSRFLLLTVLKILLVEFFVYTMKSSVFIILTVQGLLNVSNLLGMVSVSVHPYSRMLNTKHRSSRNRSRLANYFWPGQSCIGSNGKRPSRHLCHIPHILRTTSSILSLPILRLPRVQSSFSFCLFIFRSSAWCFHYLLLQN